MNRYEAILAMRQTFQQMVNSDPTRIEISKDNYDALLEDVKSSISAKAVLDIDSKEKFYGMRLETFEGMTNELVVMSNGTVSNTLQFYFSGYGVDIRTRKKVLITPTTKVRIPPYPTR